MAIVRGPAMSIAASGNLGPLCYAKWRNTVVARGRWSRTEPLIPTPLQEKYEGMLGSLASAWGQELNEEERKSWNERSKNLEVRNKLNQRCRENGYRLFLRWNMVRRVCGLTMIKWAPDGNMKVQAVSMRCIWDPLLGKVTIGLDYIPVGDSPTFSQIFKAGPFSSPGRRAWDHDYRLLVVQSAGADYEDSDVELGKWYWYAARAVDTSGVVGEKHQKKVQT